MTPRKCPWYITAHAVRRYLAIVGRADDDGPEFDRAEEELMQVAIDTVGSGRQPRRLGSGLLQYRGPKPRRLMMVVSDAERPEGPLPQLVDVGLAHAGMRRR